MQRREKRITNEIKELYKSIDVFEQSGIYFHIEDDNINIIYSMFVGQKDTPYEGGFYFVKFEYPQDYPMQPPKATYCTQGYIANNIKTRFNPNLYSCGKVCLSMLNTWSGPGWVPTNTILNILIALQAIVLNEQPLQNEPGFEAAKEEVLTRYNKIIEYANIKIAVIEMFIKQPPCFEVFKPKMTEILIKNIAFYRNYILSRINDLNKKEVESPAYGMRVTLDYEMIFTQFDSLNLDEIALSQFENMSLNAATATKI